MSTEIIAAALAAFAALIVLSAWVWLVLAVRGLRRSADRQMALLQRQIRLLETQGQAQGWLAPTEAWRPSHLQR